MGLLLRATGHSSPSVYRRRLVLERLFDVRVFQRGAVAGGRGGPSRRNADLLLCGYFLSDTKRDVKSSRVQIYP